ncbi:DEAD-box type RNA helicase, partial [Kappamyces sp. JEL0680]
MQKRLLICAPSNAAIDEIGRRLMLGINNTKGQTYHPNTIRIGKMSSVHPDVQPIGLEQLLDKEVGPDPRSSLPRDETSQQLEELEQSKKILQEKEKRDNTDMSAAIRELHSKIIGLKKAESERQKRLAGTYEKARTRAKSKLILNADIIICTLSGAGHDIFSEISGLEFETVIIDEACQAVEL